MILTCRICREDKDISEFSKANDRPLGVRNECKPCHNAKRKNYAHKKYKSSYKKYYANFSEEKKEEYRQRVRDWRLKNKDYDKQRRLKNPGKNSNERAKRRARLKNAVSSCFFVDNTGLEDIYKRCDELNKGSGKYHVDHIWPLSKGGAHHPCNLQILTASENCAKQDFHDGESGLSLYDLELAARSFA